MKLGISEERAAELEASLLQPQSTLTEDEQEYLEAFQDAMKEGNGVADDHIIRVDFEDRMNKELRDPDASYHQIFQRSFVVEEIRYT